MIKHEGDKWVLYSKDGSKKLGAFDSEDAAKTREKEIQFFKHKESGICRLLEASPDGSVYDVVLIETGLSHNGKNWTEEALRDAAPRFNGVKAYAYEYKGGRYPSQLFDHLPESVRKASGHEMTKNLTGWYDNVFYGEFDKGDGTKGKGLLAKFNITADWLKESIRNAWQKGKKDLFGFSVDLGAYVAESLSETGQKIKDVLSIGDIDEVTVVTEPGAGGRLLRLVASQSNFNIGEQVMFAKLLEWLEKAYPKLHESLPKDGKEDELQAKLLEAMGKIPATELTKLKEQGYALPEKKPDKNDPPNVTIKADDLQAKIDAGVAKALETKETAAAKLIESRRIFKEKLAESKMPDWFKKEIEADFEGKLLTEAEINGLLQRKQGALAKLQESGLNIPGQERVEVNQDEREKLVLAMEGMLADEDIPGADKVKIPRFRTLHESYRKITGFNGSPHEIGSRAMQDAAIGLPPLDVDSQIYWRHLRESRATRLQETSLTTQWAEVFGDSVRRRLMKLYDRTELGEWRKICSDIGSAPDFRTNRRQRIGGFGNLATVGSGATYPVISDTTDEEVTFAVAKRGGLYQIRFEDFVNDDMGVIRRLPRMLSTAAAQTLHEFVFDFLNDNVTLDYDSVALFHADHSNLGSVALSDAAIDDRIFAMRQQTEQDSGKPLGVGPRYLVHPSELEKTAWEITKGKMSTQGGRTETVENWVRENFNLEPIRVDYWTDANNWYLLADPKQYPTCEIDFLNGREEPEIFIQDQPTVGSVFSADKITYKIRHIYGGDWLEHRSADGSVVT